MRSEWILCKRCKDKHYPELVEVQGAHTRTNQFCGHCGFYFKVKVYERPKEKEEADKNEQEAKESLQAV